MLSPFKVDSWSKTITISPTLTEIADYRYREYVYIKTVYVPDNIKRIGFRAFRCCHKLQCVSIPSSVDLGLECFPGCYLLSKIYRRYSSDIYGSRPVFVIYGCTWEPINTESVNIFESFLSTMLKLCEIYNIDDGIYIVTDHIWPYLSE